MAGMISVRFGSDVIAAVRRLARHDGMTVSQWIRRRVDDEIRNPRRRASADYTAYPRTETAASGHLTNVTWIGIPPQQSWTGQHPQ
jgi:hypothetical protein